MRRLAARWDEIGAAFRTGDASLDEQVGAAAAKAWQHNGAAIGDELERRAGWAGLADVVAYVHRIRQARP